MIKLTNDKAALVDTSSKWIPISHKLPPRGARCLMIDRKYGVATIGPWTPDAGWTHWQALPTFLTDGDDD
jgi:hypothetical protein